MTLAVLFTHENGSIYKLKPENLDAQFKLITQGISDFEPMYMTMDDALRIVRAHYTSNISECRSNLSGKYLNISLQGKADTVSYAYYFTEEDGNIVQNMLEFPSFEEEYNLKVRDY